jgi:hypothetical protein
MKMNIAKKEETETDNWLDLFVVSLKTIDIVTVR